MNEERIVYLDKKKYFRLNKDGSITILCRREGDNKEVQK